MPTAPETPPAVVVPVRLSKHLRDFVWLLRAELLVLREAWFWYLVQASFVPLVQLAFLWLLVGRRVESVTLLVTGSLVYSLSMTGMLSLGQHLGWLKDARAFEYYAALPISRSVLVAAITTRGLLLTLPSALVVVLLGRLAFDLVLRPSGVLVLVLSAYAFAGFGAVIGFWSPSSSVASLVTQILQNLVIFFAPVYLAPEALPAWLRLASQVWPTTHAATALRLAVSGEEGTAYWAAVGILLVMALVSVALVPRKLEWRSR